MSIEYADNVTERIVEITHEITRSIKGKEGIAIAADISEMLHSIKRMSRSVNYTHSFCRLVLTEIMLLFDAPMVRIQIGSKDDIDSKNDRKKYYERKNVLECEYEAIIDAKELAKTLEDYRKECKNQILRFPRLPDGKNSPPFEDLERFRTEYEYARDKLKNKDTSKETIKKIVQEFSKINSSKYPIKKAGLFGITRLVVIPMEMPDGRTGTIEIYLDAKPREPQKNNRSEQTREFLLNDKNDTIIKKIFSVICEFETTEYSKYEVAPYNLLKDKEQFLAEAGFTADDEFPDFDDFENHFQEKFIVINNVLADICSRALENIIKRYKIEKEDYYLTFAIGQRQESELVYSYFLPSVKGQDDSPLKLALGRFGHHKKYNRFRDFRALWLEPFKFGASVMGYIPRADGFPEYIVDIDEDLRVLAYQSNVGHLEEVLIGFKPKYAMEIPIVLIQNPQNGEYELRVALVYFSKEPIPLHTRWDLFDFAYDAKEAVRTALSDQEYHRKKVVEQQAEEWIRHTAGLKHKHRQETDAYRKLFDILERFINTVREHPAASKIISLYNKNREAKFGFNGLLKKISYLKRTNEQRRSFYEFINHLACLYLDKTEDIEPDILSLRLEKDIANMITEWQEDIIERGYSCPRIRYDLSNWKPIWVQEKPAIEYMCHQLISNAFEHGRPQGYIDFYVGIERNESDTKKIKDELIFKVSNELNLIGPEYSPAEETCIQKFPEKKHISGEFFQYAKDDFKDRLWFCNGCLKERVLDDLKSGSGLFMINFHAERFYGGRLFREIDLNEKIVTFGFNIPSESGRWHYL